MGQTIIDWHELHIITKFMKSPKYVWNDPYPNFALKELNWRQLQSNKHQSKIQLRFLESWMVFTILMSSKNPRKIHTYRIELVDAFLWNNLSLIRSTKIRRKLTNNAGHKGTELMYHVVWEIYPIRCPYYFLGNLYVITLDVLSKLHEACIF